MFIRISRRFTNHSSTNQPRFFLGGLPNKHSLTFVRFSRRFVHLPNLPDLHLHQPCVISSTSTPVESQTDKHGERNNSGVLPEHGLCRPAHLYGPGLVQPVIEFFVCLVVYYLFVPEAPHFIYLGCSTKPAGRFYRFFSVNQFTCNNGIWKWIIGEY